MPNSSTTPATSSSTPSPNWAKIEKLIKSIPSNVALPIANKSHPPYHEKAIDQKWDNPLEGFALEAQAKASITILNQKQKDDDSLKLWGSKTSDALSAPILRANDSKPYLRYGIESGGKLSGKIRLGKTLPLSIDPDAQLELGFFAYRQHNNAKQLGQAILSDLPKLRTLLRPENIRRLEAGNALALKWKGSIALKAKVDWSTLLSSIVSKISTLNLTNGLLDVAVEAGMISDFEFNLEDTYLLVFAKNEKTSKMLVEVRKDHQNEIGANLGYKVAAKSSLSSKGSQKLRSLKDRIGARLMGVSTELFSKLETWAAKAEELPPELQEAINTLSQRLLNKPFATLVADEKTELRVKLKTWLDELEGTVEETAKQQFEQSLLWSYRSVKANETLIRAEIPSAYLASQKFVALHKELRRGKLSRLQALAKSQDDGDDSFFLKQVSKQQVTQFSLGISFGDFVFGKSTHTTKGFSWMENRKGELLPSFLLNTDRSINRGKETETLYAGATAIGTHYQAEDELRISNLNLDLTLNQTNQDKRIKPNEFIEYLDTARIWGAFPEDLESLEAAIEKLTAKHEQGAELIFNSKLHLTNEGMEKLLGTQSPHDAELWGEALALSLHTFLLDDSFEDLEQRREAYSEGARLAFEADDITSSVLNKIKAALKEDLESQGSTEIATYEQRALKAKRGTQASKKVQIKNRKRSLAMLRDQLLIPLCLKRKDLFSNIRGLQEFARLLHVDTDDYENRKDYEDEVYKHFDLLKYIRRNRALFRAIGCFAVLKSRSFPPETRSKLLTATFQVSETSPESGSGSILSFIK